MFSCYKMWQIIHSVAREENDWHMAEMIYNYSNEFQEATQAGIHPWVEWKHITMGKSHCKTCLRLDKCWFAKSAMPQLPQHAHCHCTAAPNLFCGWETKQKPKAHTVSTIPIFLIPKAHISMGRTSCFGFGAILRRMFSGWRRKSSGRDLKTI